MNRFVMFLLILSAGTGIAQTPQLHTGATVYIEPMDGYETYLAAAIAKKQVPLVLVTDRTKADYIITSTVSQHSPSQPTVVVNNTTNVNSNGFPAGGGFPHAGYGASQGSTSASISVVDVHSSQIVFAYAAGKSANHQLQSTAEACAKHLKEFIIQPRK